MEQGLEARLAVQLERGALSVSCEWPAAKDVSVYLVTVGTPLLQDGKTNLNSITTVSERIARQLKDGDLIILRSTVKIGVSRNTVMRILNQSKAQYDIAFCPERTVEGRALEELRTLPQIVGGDTPESAVRASQIFAMITPTVIRVEGLETAEMIKLVNNTQRDLLFAFANEVATICDNVGVSAREVITAGNMGYARASMPLPGPVGGPCLEKDPYILAESTSPSNKFARLALLGRAINEELPSIAISQIEALRKGRGRVELITIFGLAFKGRPETSDLRGTLAVKLIAELRACYPDAILRGFDPAVPPEDIAALGILPITDAYKAAASADLVIFQNNNSAFQKLDFGEMCRKMREGGYIYDFWGQFDAANLLSRNDVRYLAFGSINQVVGRA
jgi:nucleotide sugar dehydrogenase